MPKIIRSAIAASSAFLLYKQIQQIQTALNTTDIQHPGKTDTPTYTEAQDGETSKILVVVLGWGGAQRRQIQKVLDWYKKGLKIDTISYIAPMLRWGEKVDEFMSVFQQTAQLSTRERVVFHIFSQNGSLMFGTFMQRCHLIQQLQKESPNRRSADIPQSQLELNVEELYNKLDRIIFDSAPLVQVPDAPSDFGTTPIGNAIGFSTAIVAIILQKNQHTHWFYTPLIVSYLALKSVFGNFHSDVKMRIEQLLRPFNPNLKYLFMYSIIDPLLHFKSLEDFIRDRETHGFDVKKVVWQDAQHVRAFQSHHQEYAKNVKEFILSNDNKDAPVFNSLTSKL